MCYIAGDQMYGVGVGVTDRMRFFGDGEALTYATIEANITQGGVDGRLILHVTAIDGGDASSSGDGLGLITAIRWRSSDGVWQTLPGTTTGDYNLDFSSDYYGSEVPVFVQPIGTAGGGQTIQLSGTVPGTFVVNYNVIDDADQVKDSADFVKDQDIIEG